MRERWNRQRLEWSAKALWGVHNEQIILTQEGPGGRLLQDWNYRFAAVPGGEGLFLLVPALGLVAGREKSRVCLLCFINQLLEFVS